MNEITCYVAGAMIQENNEPEATFKLIKPSHSDNPYVSLNKDSHAMRMCGHTAALYYFSSSSDSLIKISDPKHYELSKLQPDTIKLTDELKNSIIKALNEGDTLLTV